MTTFCAHAVGYAYTEEYASNNGHPGWTNNIVMSKTANIREVLPSLFVLPHEVTHLLLGDGGAVDDAHHEDEQQYNLMKTPAGTDDWIGARKRLYEAQQEIIDAGENLAK